MTDLQLYLAKQRLLRERDYALERVANSPADMRKVAEEYAAKFRGLLAPANPLHD
jgi:hypothetical protein